MTHLCETKGKGPATRFHATVAPFRAWRGSRFCVGRAAHARKRRRWLLSRCARLRRGKWHGDRYPEAKRTWPTLTRWPERSVSAKRRLGNAPRHLFGTERRPKRSLRPPPINGRAVVSLSPSAAAAAALEKRTLWSRRQPEAISCCVPACVFCRVVAVPAAMRPSARCTRAIPTLGREVLAPHGQEYSRYLV
jgi:hypothetical protein